MWGGGEMARRAAGSSAEPFWWALGTVKGAMAPHGVPDGRDPVSRVRVLPPIRRPVIP